MDSPKYAKLRLLERERERERGLSFDRSVTGKAFKLCLKHPNFCIAYYFGMENEFVKNILHAIIIIAICQVYGY